ncbi:MAG: hypothetical protein PHQ74_09930 [Crocinitomicaceae bacterium]|nr:hypothetical protein [Crocinitomicaceae bacterium]
MLIYGKRKIRIKKYDDFHIQCENCSACKQRFSVYQAYYHLFFIPIYPASQKSIKTICLNCKDSFNEQKVLHYLAKTKTPFYLYTGLILFASLFISVIYSNINTQNKKQEYAENPKVNDVYLMNKKDEDDNSSYFFVKIKRISGDTVEVIHNAYEYSRFISKFDTADYFDKSERSLFLKSELKAYIHDRKITSIKRDYEKTSRFNVEK